MGINLLREGLDLPEVALVAVLDADKEGFLRSATSLIQTCGRAARNVDGRVIFYAEKETDSIRATMEEVGRRREKQTTYNAEQDYLIEHGLDPELRMPDRSGGFGLVCALTDERLHFLESTGSMRSGDVEPAWSEELGGVELRHARKGIPGARNRLFHVTFPDGRYYLGSAPEARVARNAMNDPKAFLTAFGDRAREV